MTLPPILLLPLAGWLGVAALLAGLWWWHVRLANAAVADVGWSYGQGLLAIFFAAAADGWMPRRLAIAAVITLWSLRLGTHLLVDRVWGKKEDGRYAELRRGYGSHAPARFFLFFQAQAVAALFFSIPAWLATRNAEPRWHAIEIASLALWALAFTGEVVADRQLAQFKADHAGEHRPCDVGLWRYSRHPNYFFEWVIWLACAGFALASPHGYLAVLCPAAMLYLLFRVTGIPLAEAQAIRTRGDAYRRYQQTTSAFVPWFPTAQEK